MTNECLISVSGHIGQPCNPFLRATGRCYPWSGHIVCAEDNICRCDPNYPVQIGDHLCKQGRRVGDRCSYLEECIHHDPNSYCTQEPFSSQCECLTGFEWSELKGKCVPETSGTRKRAPTMSLLIPSAAGLMMACFSLLCCCLLLWHNLCRNARAEGRDALREFHVISGGPLQQGGGRSGRNGGRCARLSLHGDRILSGHNGNMTLPPQYEAVVGLTEGLSSGNEPPPSYEDAVKQPPTSDTEAILIPANCLSTMTATTNTANTTSTITNHQHIELTTLASAPDETPSTVCENMITNQNHHQLNNNIVDDQSGEEETDGGTTCEELERRPLSSPPVLSPSLTRRSESRLSRPASPSHSLDRHPRISNSTTSIKKD